MSDQAQGPGWWLASDGKWYPPQPTAPAPPAPQPSGPQQPLMPPQQAVQPMAPVQARSGGGTKTVLILVLLVIVLVLAGGGVAVAVRSRSTVDVAVVPAVNVPGAGRAAGGGAAVGGTTADYCVAWKSVANDAPTADSPPGAAGSFLGAHSHDVTTMLTTATGSTKQDVVAFNTTMALAASDPSALSDPDYLATLKNLQDFAKANC